MRVLAVLLLAASAAHAECPVRVADAPDDVRAAIADWAHREQVCGPPLEVRVVATPQGLHLWARDPLGRTRERTVPDAESAAVLIASWMADDSISSPPPAAEVAPSHVEVDPETGALRDDREAPAPAPRPIAPFSGDRVASAPAITMGAIAGADLGRYLLGARVELEVAHLGRWTFAAIAGIDSGSRVNGSDPGPAAVATNYRVLASVGPTFWFGGWSFRPSVAIGVWMTDARVDTMPDRMHSAAEYDLSLALTRNVTRAWSIVLEPVYVWSAMRHMMIDAEGKTSFASGEPKGVEMDLMLGLRRAL